MTRLPCSRIAFAIENSTALPRPPPSSSTCLPSGISVGAPVGPMTTTLSPFRRYAHSRIERRELAREELRDFRVALLRRRHRLDDVAGKPRMVVPVEGDEPAAAAVGREEAVRIGRQLKSAAGSRCRRVRLEELPLRVELKRAAALVLIRDVRRRARGD